MINQETGFIPLAELVRADEAVTCEDGLVPVRQVVNPLADTPPNDRKIPKIVHQTGEGKCLTPPFYQNALDWSFDDHSFYFHDAAAKERLLSKFWPEFPQLQNSFLCLKNAGGGMLV